MPVLYITSQTEKSGKTMLCAGLGKNWLDNGKQVGFLKPLTGGQPGADKDAVFIHQILGIQEPVETLTPIVKESGNTGSVPQGKDILIVEGLPLKDSGKLIESLDAGVLIIHDYSTPLSAALPEYKKLGKRLLGVIINKVPRSKMGRFQPQASAELAGAGIDFIGIIPEDRILMTLSIAELAEAVQGKIVNSTDKSSELIENFMIGSSTFDRGAAYYSRKENKAVILWGERPGYRKAVISNLQLAALQTPTSCLVVSANAAPLPAVLQKAEEKQVPFISVPGTVPDLVSRLENSMGSLKFNQEKKIPHLLEVLHQNLDLNRLSRAFGPVNSSQ